MRYENKSPTIAIWDCVVDQAKRRVLHGEQVPTSEKIYSIFEPHTDLIKRRKINKPIEFGHEVFLAESARALITVLRPGWKSIGGKQNCPRIRPI
jgi:hypothetical protein